MTFSDLDELTVHPDRARVYEHGWQSWSPSTTYPVTATSARPVADWRRVGSYRPGEAVPETGFQGEGVLALDPGDGSPVTLWGAAGTPGSPVPSIRATLAGRRLKICSDAAVVRLTGPSLSTVLGQFADEYAGQTAPPRVAPTVWCSWYHYFTEVTEADMVENLAALAEHDLPVDVVQLDDGWQTEVGDWLTLSGRFSSLPELVARIRGEGRRAGIWVAPFLATARSSVVRDHPEWTYADAGQNWGSPLRALDPAHPGVQAYLRQVFESLRGMGFDYFKLDFLYAGALADLAAYRSGLELIRDAIGPDAYLLGCGAPILPSVGLFDAMRVSPDVAPHYEPTDGDLSQPGQRAAALSTVGRAWQHGRFWVNDSDCLVARPAVERREEWAAVVERYGGLRSASDRIADLDEWGLQTTRRLLGSAPPPVPFAVS